jgi:cyclic pyranopterin phosphate synthase
MPPLTHFDSEGRAVMVDVSDKAETERIAIATGRVRLKPATLALVLAQGLKKGDVLAVAQLAGIAGAKRTAELVPLCHPLALTSVKVQLKPVRRPSAIDIEARVKTTGRTGVEMEALTAVTVAALTVYDMCKAVDRDMQLTDIRLEHKSGGKSGTWQRKATIARDASPPAATRKQRHRR